MSDIKKLNDEKIKKVSGGYTPGGAISSMAGQTVEFNYYDDKTGEHICGSGVLTGRVEPYYKVSGDNLKFLDDPEFIWLPGMLDGSENREDCAELVDGRWIPCRYLDIPMDIFG